MTEYLRVCKDCTYYERNWVKGVYDPYRDSYSWHSQCNVLAHEERYDPVTGEQTGLGMGKIDCVDMRLGPCGLDGLFYAKKD